jgi:hypothetical protein
MPTLPDEFEVEVHGCAGIAVLDWCQLCLRGDKLPVFKNCAGQTTTSLLRNTGCAFISSTLQGRTHPGADLGG